MMTRLTLVKFEFPLDSTMVRENFEFLNLKFGISTKNVFDQFENTYMFDYVLQYKSRVTKLYLNWNIILVKSYWTCLVESGFYLISLACLSVSPYVHQNSVTCFHQIFVKYCMKLRVSKIKKWHSWNFEKKS